MIKSKGLSPHDLLGFVIPREDVKEYYETVIKEDPPQPSIH